MSKKYQQNSVDCEANHISMRLRNHGLLRVLLAIIAVLILVVNSVSTASAFQFTDSGRVNVQKANLLWERTYGGASDDRAFSAVKAGDGYLVAGSSKSVAPGRTVAWVLRLDGEGQVLWNRTFPAEGSGEFRYVLVLNNGFLLVGNLFKASGDIDGFVARIDFDGQLLWNLTLGGDKVDRLFSAVSVEGGFVIVGLTFSFGGGDSDAWVVKVDSGGRVVWDRTFGGAMEEAARAVVLTDDNFLAVAGYSNVKGGEDYDFLLLKLDSSGMMIWNRTYGGVQSDMAYALAGAGAGCVLVGDTRSKGMGDSDAWIVKVDGDGNVIWDRTVGGEGFDMATCVAVSLDGGFLVGGFTFSFGNGKRDFWLSKLSGSGDVMWSCTEGQSEYEEAYSVVEVSENVCVMAGWENYVEGGPYDFYVVKISPSIRDDWGSVYWVVGFVLVVVVVLLVVFVFVLKARNKIEFSRK